MKSKEEILKVIRRKFHGYSDEQFDKLIKTHPYNEIMAIVEECFSQFDEQPKPLEEIEKMFYEDKSSETLLCIEEKVIDEMIENLESIKQSLDKEYVKYLLYHDKIVQLQELKSKMKLIILRRKDQKRGIRK